MSFSAMFLILQLNSNIKRKSTLESNNQVTNTSWINKIATFLETNSKDNFILKTKFYPLRK